MQGIVPWKMAEICCFAGSRRQNGAVFIVPFGLIAKNTLPALLSPWSDKMPIRAEKIILRKYF